ncbi:MAG: hypothetical protein AAB373_00385 [Patescibacteria group bacterium]|mgnify:CR=1 FL=1
MNIILDKIASVVKNADIGFDVVISPQINCCEGAVLAVEVLEDKKVYNQLELVSGRLSTMHKGDVLAVALGNRQALRGFVGKVPESVAVGDTINVLNLGGVSGICMSANLKEVGEALKVKVLGAIMMNDKPVNIKDHILFSPLEHLGVSAPLIIVSGTCMNVGKTSVAGEMIKHAKRAGLKIFGAKLAGVAAMRDTESMRDYGASKVVSFLDAGFPSTVHQKESVAVAKGAIEYLSKGNPDFIVIEFGDGIFGEYGVMPCLQDPEIQKNIVAHIGCAYDPAGAVKLKEVCAEIGAPLDIISGPVTDNSVGVSFIKETLGIPGFNAFLSSEELFKYLHANCLKK